MLESRIQKFIVTWLRSIGCKVIILKVGSVRGNADLIICYKGMYIEFEMKQPGKRATKLQLVKKVDTEEAGGYWFEIHDLAEAMDAIHIVSGIAVDKGVSNG